MSEQRLHIGYAPLGDPGAPEHAAAETWIEDAVGGVKRVSLCSLADPPEMDVLWIHGSGGEATDRPLLPPETRERLLTYVHRGGRLLCTNLAAFIPHDIGVETVIPEARAIDIRDEGYGRGRGFQSYGDHPLFETFFGGVYVWNPEEDHEAERIGYFGDQWPEQGHVIGIDKGYITIDPDSRLVVEHRHGQGMILSVGAYVHMGAGNRNAPQLRRFLQAAIEYLVEAPQVDLARTWCRDTCRPVEVEVSAPSLESPPPPHQVRLRDLPVLSREEATDGFFDVAGRRCVVMGTERGGIDELWCHPFRILHDLDVGVVTGGGVQWLRDVPARVEVHPHVFVRQYHLEGGVLEEMVFAARSEPAAAVRFRGDHDLQLIVRHATDFRWMWPYREDALGSLHFGRDDATGALHVHDRSRRFYALFGADRLPEQSIAGAFAEVVPADGRLEGTPSDANVVRHGAIYALKEATQRTLHFAMAGSSIGRGDAEAAFRRMLGRPDEVLDEAAEHFERLLATATMVTSPDAEFNEGYRWAIIGTDRFRAETPGIGTGLLAGYGTTKKGWHGGHAINGRPGYGWYFARDAAWSCLALNAYGDFATVRDELRMFERYQGASGKIFFEIPLSGVVHYDSADATPLYLILAADYLRVSGDAETIESLWPSLMRAIDFLYSTDTDGDGFIENRNVGHGWVEGGALFGVRTELYLAGLWVQALLGASRLAQAVGDTALTQRFSADAETMRARLERVFWDEEGEFLRFAKSDDGEFISERTIFAAIPLMYQQVAPDNARPILDAFASNEFSTDWGTHIISTRSDLFDPKGYHLGTVWPLFTGWTALAEYAYRRPVAAFTHLMNNLLVYRHWGLGLIEEVLNGERYAPAGVCAHQCWSETNVLHPVLAGMIGLDPDALRGRLGITPQLPIHWDRVSVTDIHVGETRLDMTFERNGGMVRYDFVRTGGAPVDITVEPAFPPGTTVRAVGADVLTTTERGATTFHLENRASIAYATSGGIGVIPDIPHPRPEDRSSRTRIIRQSVRDDVYRLVVEGAPGTTETFRLRCFRTNVTSADGATVEPSPRTDIVHLHVTYPASAEAWVRTEIRLALEAPSDNF